MLSIVEMDDGNSIPWYLVINRRPYCWIYDVVSSYINMACIDAKSDTSAILFFKCIDKSEQVEHIAEHLRSLSRPRLHDQIWRTLFGNPIENGAKILACIFGSGVVVIIELFRHMNDDPRRPQFLRNCQVVHQTLDLLGLGIRPMSRIDGIGSMNKELIIVLINLLTQLDDNRRFNLWTCICLRRLNEDLINGSRWDRS